MRYDFALWYEDEDYAEHILTAQVYCYVVFNLLFCDSAYVLLCRFPLSAAHPYHKFDNRISHRGPDWTHSAGMCGNTSNPSFIYPVSSPLSHFSNRLRYTIYLFLFPPPFTATPKGYTPCSIPFLICTTVTPSCSAHSFTLIVSFTIHTPFSCSNLPYNRGGVSPKADGEVIINLIHNTYPLASGLFFCES